MLSSSCSIQCQEQNLQRALAKFLLNREKITQSGIMDYFLATRLIHHIFLENSTMLQGYLSSF